MIKFVIKQFLISILQAPLASLYGSIDGLCELGPEVVKGLVIPKIKDISDRIEVCMEGINLSTIDKNGAGHIKTLLIVSFSVINQNYKKKKNIS